MNTYFDIFNELHNTHIQEEDEHNFLEVDDIFSVGQYQIEDLSFNVEEEPIIDQTTPFNPNLKDVDSEVNSSLPQKQTKHTFQSSYNKNVCFNICQKTIKVIKKGVFEEKFLDICEEHNLVAQQFKAKLVKNKKDFTGPKALSNYLEQQTEETKAFAQFMKWFLSEKYLRMAINEGEMKNLKVYISFKNTHILPLLE